MNRKNIKYAVYSFFLFLSIEIIVQSKGYGIIDYLKSVTIFEEYDGRLESSLGVKFSNGLAGDVIPESWKSTSQLGTENSGEPVESKARVIHLFELLSDEVRVLPDSVKSDLKIVVIVSHLVNRGLSSGGTYDPGLGALYIATESDSGVVPDEYVASTFHHELSSMLMEKYSFDEIGWRNILGKDFKYESDKNPFYFIAVLEHDVEIKEEEYYFKRGLVSYYGETGVENDLNEYVGMIFSDPEKMKSLISEYPKIKEKYAYIKSFYLSIDEGFKPIFDKIGKG